MVIGGREFKIPLTASSSIIAISHGCFVIKRREALPNLGGVVASVSSAADAAPGLIGTFVVTSSLSRAAPGRGARFPEAFDVHEPRLRSPLCSIS